MRPQVSNSKETKTSSALFYQISRVMTLRPYVRKDVICLSPNQVSSTFILCH